MQAVAALRRSKRIYTYGLHGYDFAAFGLARSEDLSHWVSPDTPRTHTYSEIVDFVLDDVSSGTRPVAFATYGSPLVGLQISHDLRRRGSLAGLQISVVNGTSFLDGIWEEFGVDPFLGFQLWDATVLVERDITPVVTAPLVVAQPTMLRVNRGIKLFDRTAELPDVDLTDLGSHLGLHYPNDHTVYFVSVASWGRRAELQPMHLRELIGLRKTQDLTSLFVPPVVRDDD
jgi:uncharacterized protein YabN with tetrapyrrole methylase and pyrophosphatase domain